jgi:hypothetical protein
MIYGNGMSFVNGIPAHSISRASCIGHDRTPFPALGSSVGVAFHDEDDVSRRIRFWGHEFMRFPQIQSWFLGRSKDFGYGKKVE